MARPVVAGWVVAAAAAGAITAMACSDGNSSATTTTSGSGGSGGAEQPLTAEEFYRERVDPELSVTCGICHSDTADCTPLFMGVNPGGSYQALKGYPGLVTHPDNSNLIYHGVHTGPALTSVQEGLVREWLALERPDPPPGKTLVAALVEFGECMSLTDFEAEEVYLLAHQQTDAGPCGACHGTGEAGTWIGYNEDEMWAKNAALPWIKRLVEPVFDANNDFVDFGASNRFVDKVQDANQCGSAHPAAIVAPTIVGSLVSYFDLSHNRWVSNACDEMQ